jgi:[acyl-carrier-protein] S-malonyltransferase
VSATIRAGSHDAREVLAIVAPGQGAQTPGFLAPWLDDPAFEARIHWLSAVAGIDLAHYGTQADAETIRDTAVAQPLLVAAGMLGALTLFPQPGDAFGKVGVAAGHSVGEITAAAGVRVITAEQAMVFAHERGRAMAEASAVTPSGMTAVLGGDPDDVFAALEKHHLDPAHVNGGGQIVAAGTLDQLEALAAEPPAGARLRPLSVAGAFHTRHMAPAVDILSRHARAISTHDPRTRLLSNRDGRVVHDGRDVLARLVGQVANPARWDLCQQTMTDLGVTGLLEVPPAGTLTGLAKRAMPGVETFALKTPDQLDDARAFVETHGQASQMNAHPTWRLVVAPMKGTFTAAGVGVGARLGAGDLVGTVNSLRDSLDVTAAHGGTVIEWLVEDGDPVAPGQPLVRLHPESHQEAVGA